MLNKNWLLIHDLIQLPIAVHKNVQTNQDFHREWLKKSQDDGHDDALKALFTMNVKKQAELPSHGEIWELKST